MVLPIWPRIGIWLAAALAVAVGLPVLDASSLPAFWLLNSVGFAAVGLFDRLARHRQRLISAGWAEWRETDPIIDPDRSGGRTPPGQWLAVVPAGLTIVIGSLLAMLYARHQPAIPGDLPEPKRVLVDQPEGAFDQPPAGSKRRVHRGLLAWVDDVWIGGEPMARVQRGGTEVAVGGLLSDARPLAVMHQGRWLISTLPLRDPWTLRRWRH